MARTKILIASKEDVFTAINSGLAVSSRPVLIGLIALGGTFVDAYDFTSLGIGTVQLKTQFHLSSAALGSLTSSMAVGALAGALIGGYYADKIGRFTMFLLDLVLFVVSAIGAALSPDLAWLIAFRVLMGLGVGLDFPVALSFVAEFASIRRKSRFVNGWQIMWYAAATGGFLVLLAVHAAGVTADLWRYAVGLGAVPAAAVLLLRYMYMDESPMWAASTGNLAEAARILQKRYGLDASVAPGGPPEDSGPGPAGAGAALSPRAAKVLFSARYRPRTILAGVVGMTQSMEYFALGFYLPAIIALLFGENLSTVLWASALFNAFGIVGAVTNVATTNRLGLRRMTLAGYSGVIVAMALIGIFGKGAPGFVTAVLLIVFIAFHAYGQGTSGMTLGALSYPPAIRGIGAGFTQAIIRAGSILGFYFFPLLLASLGLYRTTLLLILVPLTGLVVTAVIRWDPVGRDIESEESEPWAAGLARGSGGSETAESGEVLP
jgi:MFS transporter, putative metabolite transport protein